MPKAKSSKSTPVKKAVKPPVKKAGKAKTTKLTTKPKLAVAKIKPVDNLADKLAAVATGIRIEAVFGLIWWIAALTSFKKFPIVLAVLGVVAALFLLVKARQIKAQVGAVNVLLSARYWRQVFAALLAIVVAVSIGHTIHRNGIIPPLITIVVGLHFVPLGRLCKQPRYIMDGLIMTLLGIVLTIVSIADKHVNDSAILLYDGLCSAGVLWSSAFSSIYDEKPTTLKEA
jgi:hypothetical protein